MKLGSSAGKGTGRFGAGGGLVFLGEQAQGAVLYKGLVFPFGWNKGHLQGSGRKQVQESLRPQHRGLSAWDMLTHKAQRQK